MILDFFRRWKLHRKFKKSMLLQDGKYRVEQAFRVDGVLYYQFDNALHIPADRAFSALTIYEEFNMRCTREYLEKHCRAVDILLQKKELGIQDIMALATIHKNLNERLNLAPHQDLIFKYASVVYFDENESPYMYDPVYNETKIKRWKEMPGMLDFFLTQPMLNLMPHLGMSKKHFQMYLEVAEAFMGKYQKDLDEVLSKNN